MKKAVLIYMLVLTAAGVAHAQMADDPCRNPETAAFDFQIGVWVSSDGKQVHEITKALDGCAVEEVWRTEGRISAKALKSFDNGNHAQNGEKRWYYTWTARGHHQLWEGRKEEGNWRFYRSWGFNGKPMLSRTYWTRLTPNTLERIVEQSLDDGKTWRSHVKDLFARKQL